MPAPIRPTSTTPPLRALNIIAFAVVVFGLWAGREVFIPLALAILLSFVLAPIVIRFQKFGLSRIIAVITVVTLAFVVLAAVMYVVTAQVIDLARQLPAYRTNIRQKIESLTSSSTGPFGQAAENVKQIADDLSKNGGARAGEEVAGGQAAASHSPEPEPIPVVVQEPAPTAMESLAATAGAMIDPLITAGIVIVFVVFILIYRENLRDRILRLAGRSQLTASTQALNEAAYRVSRFLISQLIVNATYGIPVAIGLYLIGVPNAILWGLLALVLRFIPYAGPIVAAAMPIALSFAIDPGWTKPALTASLFIVLELISNNVIEPWLYGTRTGITPVALLVSAAVWATLWGPIGLMLSVPLTVCLVVIGRHVPQLEFLDVLLGDEPALSPAERIYQRLLVMDQDEATEQAEELLEESDLLRAFDEALLPALAMAERDVHSGAVDEPHERFIHQSTQEMIDELRDRAEIERAATAEGAGESAEARPVKVDADAPSGEEGKAPARRDVNLTGAKILCVPVYDQADEIAARMLQHVVELAGGEVRVAPQRASMDEITASMKDWRDAILCISALPPYAATNARRMCRRIRMRTGRQGPPILIGLWHIRGDAEKARQRLMSAGATAVAITLDKALEQISEMAGRKPQREPEEHRERPDSSRDDEPRPRRRERHDRDDDAPTPPQRDELRRRESTDRK